MKRMMNRGQLKNMDAEFQSYKNDQPGLFLAINEKIKKFYQAAEHELRVTDSRLNGIKDLYIQKDEAGGYLTVKDGDITEWKYIDDGESLKRANVIDVSMVKSDFETACTKLMNQVISFDL